MAPRRPAGGARVRPGRRPNERLPQAPGVRYTRAMPQKPQARARDKKRLTKRLANWRKKQELAAKPAEPSKTAATPRG